MTRINYVRVNWQDYPDSSTPLSSDNLNNMDNGLAALYQDVADLEEAVAVLTLRVAELEGGSDDLISGEETFPVSEEPVGGGNS